MPPAVLRSGEYFLFESDSEEEEEVQEEPRVGRPSAFQVSRAGGLHSSQRAGSVPSVLMAPVPVQLAYQAWVTNTRTVLRQQEQPEQSQPPSSESAAGGCDTPKLGWGGRRGHSPACCPLCVTLWWGWGQAVRLLWCPPWFLRWMWVDRWMGEPQK